jgi:hypothetical protein
MLIIRRFSHRHSRSFFIANVKRENPLNECENTFIKKRENPLRENPLRENPLRENPLNECEKSFYSALYKKNVNPVIDNPLNECENTRQ